MDEYYKLGYRKYLMGERDQALMIFSFWALNGRYIWVKAATYMWENDLTTNLTWRLGHHKICASYYYFLLYLKGFKENIMKVPRFISQYTDIISDKNSMQYEIYRHMRTTEAEAMFRLVYDYHDYENLTEAIKILDELIVDSLTNTIDFRNLIPSLLVKVYYLYKYYVEF